MPKGYPLKGGPRRTYPFGPTSGLDRFQEHVLFGKWVFGNAKWHVVRMMLLQGQVVFLTGFSSKNSLHAGIAPKHWRVRHDVRLRMKATVRDGVNGWYVWKEDRP